MDKHLELKGIQNQPQSCSSNAHLRTALYFAYIASRLFAFGELPSCCSLRHGEERKMADECDADICRYKSSICSVIPGPNATEYPKAYLGRRSRRFLIERNSEVARHQDTDTFVHSVVQQALLAEAFTYFAATRLQTS